MNTATDWTPPYDPRQIDSSTMIQDEHGRLIATADCGQRCPGCGLCCAEYRDVVGGDYFGTEEFEGNLKMGRGGLIRLDDDSWYRVAMCGKSCPGYGRCCPPSELRQRPQTVADARHVLLQDDAAKRWQMQESLLILAHDGSAEAVDVLETFMPRAHTCLAGFAECALDEGRYFATVPRNAEEAYRMMRQEVLAAWEERAICAQGKIWEEIEPQLERLRYEKEIAQRLLDKAQDEPARETWQTQVDVVQTMIALAEDDLAAQQKDIELCEAVMVEIEADLSMEQPQEG